MRTLVCSVVLLSGCAKDVLNPACPTECFTGPKQLSKLGECRPGKPVCNAENTKVLSCEGEVLPQDEICDGKDNNCNGYTDEEAFISDWQLECLPRGVCANTEPECKDGKEVCDYPSSYEEGSETRCDGLDNDCDGIVDENIFAGQYCYEGPIGTEFNPPCHPGALSCVDGDAVCVNQVRPSFEMCDAIDNDCNGIIDDTSDTLSTKYDFVFNFDTSGSMSDEINAVAVATGQYSAQFSGNPNYRFALVIMSQGPTPYVVLRLDFTDFDTFQNQLNLLTANGSATEASLDSMFMVCSSTNPLGLSWDEDANGLLFTFTDEPPQTYTSPFTTGTNIIDACLASGVLPFIWSRNAPGFDYIATGANGLHFPLESTWQPMFDDLNSIVIKICGS